eukprot:GHVU01050929.1.p2 GENE.GHVU01050929.1~~GHVU01050929.1.p2  ORF type:complete len:134 (-),score=16.58 GHVU01050929.1:608-982(-)
MTTAATTTMTMTTVMARVPFRRRLLKLPQQPIRTAALSEVKRHNFFKTDGDDFRPAAGIVDLPPGLSGSRRIVQAREIVAAPNEDPFLSNELFGLHEAAVAPPHLVEPGPASQRQGPVALVWYW